MNNDLEKRNLLRIFVKSADDNPAALLFQDGRIMKKRILFLVQLAVRERKGHGFQGVALLK